jgi:hypothetical protein
MQGPRNKEGLVLSEEEYNQLQELEFIIEKDKLVCINPEKITTVIENDNKHFFVFKEEEDFVLAEHLNEPQSLAIKIESTDPQDFLSVVELHTIKKEKIEEKLKHIFKF